MRSTEFDENLSQCTAVKLILAELQKLYGKTFELFWTKWIDLEKSLFFDPIFEKNDF